MKIFITAIMVFFIMTGCSKEDESTTPSKPAYEFIDGDSVSFTLPTSERFILEGTATFKLYDADTNTLIGVTPSWSIGEDIPNPIPAGNYLAKFSDTDGEESTRIFYYLSSGYPVSSIPVGKNISVAYRSATLHKLTLSESKTFTLDTQDSFMEVFDASLHSIGVNFSWRSEATILSDPLTLEKGDYYFVATPFDISTSSSYTLSPF